MNPNVETSLGMGLPEPQSVEGQATQEQVDRNNATTPENRQAFATEAVPVAAMPPSTAIKDDASTALPITTTNPVPTVVTPATAGDDDLIDKEWVVKAKQIVDGTRQDPYQQTRQLAAFKADYLQKRYNKTVKLSE